MILFIKKLLIFSFFSFVFYVVFLFLWGEYMPKNLKKNLNYFKCGYGHTFSRIKELKQTKDVDLLFLGSSHAYRGFDTRFFNQNALKSFNLGSSSQSHIQTNLLLNRYLDSLSPELVVYEVYPGIFTSDGVESALDIMSNDKIDVFSLKMAIEENHIKVYNSLIYGFFYNLFHDDYNLKEDKIKEMDTYCQGGYVMQKTAYFKKVQYPKTSWQFSSKQFEYFYKNLNLLREKKIKYLLVQAPITKARYQSYKNNEEFDEKMSSVGTYFNFNKILPLDDSLFFYDEHHLNQDGVDKFNKFLLEKIIKKF